MIFFIAYLLFALFLLLSAIHIYWGAGGQAWIGAALPVNRQNKRVLSPKPLHSFTLGAGFAGLAVLVLIKAGILYFRIPCVLQTYGLGGVALFFFARAVGDFKYAGLFKRIKNSRFGWYDTRIYTPLCLFIGCLIIILEWQLRETMQAGACPAAGYPCIDYPD
ncbi:DUF3995 domain-containing protein [Niabella drilacis]|nr:DUF3995 domain-containing protein [Niabella drilacis]